MDVSGNTCGELVPNGLVESIGWALLLTIIARFTGD
jgi:hypothetical protein